MKTKITIKAGAGGEESEAFARILYKMYKNWADRKSISKTWYSEDGHTAFNLTLDTDVDLSKEHGVHRLVRISPFDSQSRRHTSFAAVNVAIDGKLVNEIEPHEHQIRSYVLDPYTQAQDYRNGLKLEDVANVLAGGEQLDILMGL